MECKRLTVGQCLRELADEHSKRREEILKRGVLFDLLNTAVDEWNARYPDGSTHNYVSCPTNPFTVDSLMVALNLSPENVLADVFRFVSDLSDRITAFGFRAEFVKRAGDSDYMIQEWTADVRDDGKRLFGLTVRVFPSYSPSARCKLVQVGTKEAPVFEAKCTEGDANA